MGEDVEAREITLHYCIKCNELLNNTDVCKICDRCLYGLKMREKGKR
tara:strand:- start:1015 stop:1155 length:141 start_codon:yes stop_codon:yes gene_type:complete